MDSNVQVKRQPSYSLEVFNGFVDKDFDFDVWAIAVRRQMLATIKRREGSRSNWGRLHQ